MHRYPAHCCQRCGAYIGYLGRGVDWFTRPFGFVLHDCDPMPEPVQRAYGGNNVQQNWFASAEALRWMLYMMCWSDEEAMLLFGVSREGLNGMLDGSQAALLRTWTMVYMPVALMVRDQLLDGGHWPFPPLTPIPIGRMPDARLSERPQG